MTVSFLSPAGNYAETAAFCGIKSDPATLFDFQLAVDVAAEEVRARCGPVLLEADLVYVSETPADTIVTPFRVAALTSVTSLDGDPFNVADFHVPAHRLGGHGGQIVRRKDGGTIPASTVVYTSGWSLAAVPGRLKGAGREIARHLWRTQLGSQRTGDEQGGAWLWPRQAEALAEDWLLTPIGFA